ncbi:acyl-CoA dehydrogenase family protein [Microbacterium sp. NIBRBAC000506063]|uniref:acyl-CoA dehydrogenase family protein n=1 Tax=Microbacterium sp. NIBRBAC000506063 TaxID=2734618 RepID=UPI001CB725A8|nr:acyl-CoA dehydrogenase family protein [Microbacterium sp. NIBRBAC000506063]
MMETAVLDDLRSATRTFIRETVIPAEPKPGERLDPDVRHALAAEARRAGVFAPQAPKEFGGLGLDIRQWSPIFQEAGYSPIGPSVINCMAPDEGNMYLLEAIASPEQRDAFLAPLARGQIRSCFAMTEPHPGAGSDPAALSTTATRVDGGWRIDGEKRFISGANGAAFAIVMARNEESEGVPAGSTMLLVDMSNPGVRIGEAIHTTDRAIDGGHPYVHFENCLVSDNAVLGEPGRGFSYAQVRLGPARLTHCMRWLGLARRSLDIALDRAAHREVFGSLLQDLGIAQTMIADSVIDIETSDAMIDKAVKLLAEDSRVGSAMSSVAKVYCSEAIFRVMDRAIQLTGGDGVSDALPLAQYINEVRPFRIYDGSNETHRWAIARHAGNTRRRSGYARQDVVQAGDA